LAHQSLVRIVQIARAGYVRIAVWYNDRMDKKLIYEEETYAIRGAIFEVYKTLGSGFLEDEAVAKPPLASGRISVKCAKLK